MKKRTVCLVEVTPDGNLEVRMPVIEINLLTSVAASVVAYVLEAGGDLGAIMACARGAEMTYSGPASAPVVFSGGSDGA
jgi:hypothetical protein